MPDFDIIDSEAEIHHGSFGSHSIVDEEFDDMVTFGLHDEHSVRRIMDLPPHTMEMSHVS